MLSKTLITFYSLFVLIYAKQELKIGKKRPTKELNTKQTVNENYVIMKLKLIST